MPLRAWRTLYKPKPEDVREQHESQRKDLQSTHGEAMLGKGES